MIRVQLSDVDYESIVERAKGEDNEGRRRELLKDLVSEASASPRADQDISGAYPHDGHLARLAARGRRRVRQRPRPHAGCPTTTSGPGPDTWRFVIDHPFDDAGHSARRGPARLDEMVAAGFEARTIVWLPRFLSDERMRELRRLVILDWLLDGTGERWRTHADHLNEADRAQARAILESQRNALRAGLRRRRAGGLRRRRATPGHARRGRVARPGPGLARPLGSPRPTRWARPGRPRSATCWTRRSGDLPGAPALRAGRRRGQGPGPGGGRTRTSSAPSPTARGGSGWRGDIAAVRRVANPLGVGTATEMHFLFGDDRFARGARRSSAPPPATACRRTEPVTVAQLRGWIDAMRRRSGCGTRSPTSSSWPGRRCGSGPGTSTAAPVPATAPRAGARPGDGAAARAAARPRRLAEAATSRAEPLFGVDVNPYLTAAGRRRTDRQHQLARRPAGRRRRRPRPPRRGRLPARWARPEGNGIGWPPPGRPPRCCSRLQRAGRPGARWSRRWPGLTCPRTEPAVASSLHQARAGVQRAARVPVGPARAAARGRSAPDDRGPGRRRHRCRSAGGADARTSSPPDWNRRCSPTDDAIFEWLAAGQPRPSDSPRSAGPRRRSPSAARAVIGWPRDAGPRGARRVTCSSRCESSWKRTGTRTWSCEWRVRRSDQESGPTRATLPVLRALLDQAPPRTTGPASSGSGPGPSGPGPRVHARRGARADRALRVGAGRAGGADRAGTGPVAGRPDRPPRRRPRRRRPQPPGLAPAAYPRSMGRGAAPFRRDRHRPGADRDRPATGRSPPGCWPPPRRPAGRPPRPGSSPVTTRSARSPLRTSA